MITHLLTTCGFNPSEQRVLLCLLEYGSSIVSLIAKRTALKRPTVYSILDSLVGMGIVTKQRKKKVTYFTLVSPSLIPRILKNQAEKKFHTIKQATELLKQPLEHMWKNTPVDLSGYKITTLDTIVAIFAQIEEHLLKGDILSIFNPQKAFKTEEGKRVGLSYLKETSRTKVSIREIIVSGHLAEWYKKIINNPNHVIKEVPENTLFFSDMIFVNGTVVISHYEPHQEMGIKIQQKDLYRSMVTLFEMLWKKTF